jgi:hypothetical protein
MRAILHYYVVELHHLTLRDAGREGEALPGLWTAREEPPQ